MKLTNILEVSFSEAPKVDREAGVIRDVRILGRVSKNGREYSDTALAQAARMYEGLGVNLNHPDRKSEAVERPVQDGFGWLESVQVRADGVYGNLHFLKSHPAAPMICESAERNPKRFGLSHNAQGRVVSKNGKNVVESIETVRSVDVVQNPATNTGLFESQENLPMKITLKEFAAKMDRKNAESARLVKLMEMDEYGAMPMEVASTDMSADDHAKAAFKAMINGVLDDDSLDLAAKKKKIGDILGMQEKLLNKSEESTPAGDGGAESEGGDTATESHKPKDDAMLTKLQEQVATLTKERDESRTREACRALLESKKREVTDVRLSALAAVSEGQRTALVESWPEKSEAKPARQKPEFSAPLTESFKPASDPKSFASRIA